MIIDIFGNKASFIYKYMHVWIYNYLILILNEKKLQEKGLFYFKGIKESKMPQAYIRDANGHSAFNICRC